MAQKHDSAATTITRSARFSRTSSAAGLASHRTSDESTITMKHLRTQHTLPVGQSLCEACMWTTWWHAGKLSCLSHGKGQLLAVHANHFAQVVKEDVEVHRLCARRASDFVDSLNRAMTCS